MQRLESHGSITRSNLHSKIVTGVDHLRSGRMVVIIVPVVVVVVVIVVVDIAVVIFVVVLVLAASFRHDYRGGLDLGGRCRSCGRGRGR